jgi:hypothetical protein
VHDPQGWLLVRKPPRVLAGLRRREPCQCAER